MYRCLLALLFSSLVFARAEDARINIDPIIEKIREQHQLPALAAAAIVDGKIVAVSAVGVRRIAEQTGVTIDDKFHLGSCTKAMTATLAAVLVEAGKIKWESTLEQVFPELVPKMNTAYRKLTLEQIVAQRSGLPADTDGGSAVFRMECEINALPGAIAVRRGKLVEKILAQPPANPPGEKYVYANQNFVLAAAMLERATGTPWEKLAADRLFRPLGMSTVGFGAMGTPHQGDQPLQHRVDAGGKVVPLEPGPNADNPEIMTPAGRVHCSIGDWAKFILEHVRGESGNSKLLNADSFKRLHTPKPGAEYVAGWIVTTRPWASGSVLTHSGTNNYNYATVWMAPADGFAVLAVTNQGGDVAAKACDQVCGALIKRWAKGGK